MCTMQRIELRDDQNKRYAVTISAFLVLIAFAVAGFYHFRGYVPARIPPYDLFILALSSFRLIRLFTYDQIMRVVRDIFIDKKEVVGEDGQVILIRTKPLHGFKRSISDLLGCPWCMGIWVSYFTVLLYFAFPPIRYFALVLALAGLGSGLQIFMNMIGARTEWYKHKSD